MTIHQEQLSSVLPQNATSETGWLSCEKMESLKPEYCTHLCFRQTCNILTQPRFFRVLLESLEREPPKIGEQVTSQGEVTVKSTGFTTFERRFAMA